MFDRSCLLARGTTFVGLAGIVGLFLGLRHEVHGANTYFPSPESQDQFELMLKTAHSLRVNMIRVLGGILQSDHELSWEQLVTISRLHQNLVSRQESAILLIPRAKIVLAELNPTVERQMELMLSGWSLKVTPDITSCQGNFSTSLAKTIKYSKNKDLLFNLNSDLDSINADTVQWIFTKMKSNAKGDEGYLNQIIQEIRSGFLTLSYSLLLGIINHIPLYCILPDDQESFQFLLQNVFSEDHLLNEIVNMGLVGKYYDANSLVKNVLLILNSKNELLSQKSRLRIMRLKNLLKEDNCERNNKPSISYQINYRDIFSTIKLDEFPEDVTNAKETLIALSEKENYDLVAYLYNFDSTLYGNDRDAILLAFLEHLSVSIPIDHAASVYVHTLLIHMKIKVITKEGGTFVPTSHSDIVSLLNAFGTLNIDMTELNTDISHAFRDEIDWRYVLKNFPYDAYSRPRTLLIAMFNYILGFPNYIKPCHKIIISSFLEKTQPKYPMYQITTAPYNNAMLNYKKPSLNASVELPWQQDYSSIASHLPLSNEYDTFLLNFSLPINKENTITKGDSNDYIDENLVIKSCPNSSHKVKLLDMRRIFKSIDSNAPKDHVRIILEYIQQYHIESLSTKPFDSRGYLLKALLNSLLASNDLDKVVTDAIYEVLPFVATSSEGAIPADTYYSCKPKIAPKAYLTLLSPNTKLYDNLPHSNTSNKLVQQFNMQVIKNKTKILNLENEEIIHDLEFCGTIPNTIIWFDVEKLLKALSPSTSTESVFLVQHLLNSDFVQNFPVGCHKTRASLLRELLHLMREKLILPQKYVNAIDEVKNKILSNGTASLPPVFVCITIPTVEDEQDTLQGQIDFEATHFSKQPQSTLNQENLTPSQLFKTKKDISTFYYSDINKIFTRQPNIMDMKDKTYIERETSTTSYKNYINVNNDEIKFVVTKIPSKGFQVSPTNENKTSINSKTTTVLSKTGILMNIHNDKVPFTDNGHTFSTTEQNIPFIKQGNIATVDNTEVTVSNDVEREKELTSFPLRWPTNVNEETHKSYISNLPFYSTDTPFNLTLELLPYEVSSTKYESATISKNGTSNKLWNTKMPPNIGLKKASQNDLYAIVKDTETTNNEELYVEAMEKKDNINYDELKLATLLTISSESATVASQVQFNTLGDTQVNEEMEKTASFQVATVSKDLLTTEKKDIFSKLESYLPAKPMKSLSNVNYEKIKPFELSTTIYESMTNIIDESYNKNGNTYYKPINVDIEKVTRAEESSEPVTIVKETSFVEPDIHWAAKATEAEEGTPLKLTIISESAINDYKTPTTLLDTTETPINKKFKEIEEGKLSYLGIEEVVTPQEVTSFKPETYFSVEYMDTLNNIISDKLKPIILSTTFSESETSTPENTEDSINVGIKKVSELEELLNGVKPETMKETSENPHTYLPNKTKNGTKIFSVDGSTTILNELAPAQHNSIGVKLIELENVTQLYGSTFGLGKAPLANKKTAIFEQNDVSSVSISSDVNLVKVMNYTTTTTLVSSFNDSKRPYEQTPHSNRYSTPQLPFNDGPKGQTNKQGTYVSTEITDTNEATYTQKGATEISLNTFSTHLNFSNITKKESYSVNETTTLPYTVNQPLYVKHETKELVQNIATNLESINTTKGKNELSFKLTSSASNSKIINTLKTTKGFPTNSNPSDGNTKYYLELQATDKQTQETSSFYPHTAIVATHKTNIGLEYSTFKSNTFKQAINTKIETDTIETHKVTNQSEAFIETSHELGNIETHFFLIPTEERCHNSGNNSLTIVISIESMFEAISPNVSKNIKRIVSNFLAHQDAYKYLEKYVQRDLSLVGIHTNKMYARNLTRTLKVPSGPFLRKSLNIPCTDNHNINQVLWVSIPLLFETLDSKVQNQSIKLVLKYITKEETRHKLKDFDLTIYKTRGDLLKEMLLFLMSKFIVNIKVHDAINYILEHIRLDGPGKLPPQFDIPCSATPQYELADSWLTLTSYQNSKSEKLVSEKENSIYFIPDTLDILQTENDACGDLCSNKALLLDKLLMHFVSNSDIGNTVINAMNTVKKGIIHGGAGLLSPDIFVVCNSSVGRIKEITKSISIIDDAFQLETRCKTGLFYVSRHKIFRIDVPKLFQAVQMDRNLEEYVLTLSYISASDILSKLSEANEGHMFDILKYNTRGELLRDILMIYKRVPYLTDYAIRSIEKVQNNIALTGIGALSPEAKYVCDEEFLDIDQNLAPQSLISSMINTIDNPQSLKIYSTYPIDSTVTPAGIPSLTTLSDTDNMTTIINYEQDILRASSCLDDVDKSSKISNVDILDLFSAVNKNASKNSLNIVTKYLLDQNIKRVQDINFDNYKTKGELLRDLLLFVKMNTDIEPIMSNLIDEILVNILVSGPGGIPPVLKLKCPSSSLTKNTETENSEEATELTLFTTMTETLNYEKFSPRTVSVVPIPVSSVDLELMETGITKENYIPVSDLTIQHYSTTHLPLEINVESLTYFNLENDVTTPKLVKSLKKTFVSETAETKLQKTNSNIQIYQDKTTEHFTNPNDKDETNFMFIEMTEPHYLINKLALETTESSSGITNLAAEETDVYTQNTETTQEYNNLSEDIEEMTDQATETNYILTETTDGPINTIGPYTEGIETSTYTIKANDIVSSDYNMRTNETVTNEEITKTNTKMINNTFPLNVPPDKQGINTENTIGTILDTIEESTLESFITLLPEISRVNTVSSASNFETSTLSITREKEIETAIPTLWVTSRVPIIQQLKETSKNGIYTAYNEENNYVTLSTLFETDDLIYKTSSGTSRNSKSLTPTTISFNEQSQIEYTLSSLPEISTALENVVTEKLAESLTKSSAFSYVEPKSMSTTKKSNEISVTEITNEHVSKIKEKITPTIETFNSLETETVSLIESLNNDSFLTGEIGQNPLLEITMIPFDTSHLRVNSTEIPREPKSLMNIDSLILKENKTFLIKPIATNKTFNENYANIQLMTKSSYDSTTVSPLTNTILNISRQDIEKSTRFHPKKHDGAFENSKDLIYKDDELPPLELFLDPVLSSTMGTLNEVWDSNKADKYNTTDEDLKYYSITSTIYQNNKILDTSISVTSEAYIEAWPVNLTEINQSYSQNQIVDHNNKLLDLQIAPTSNTIYEPEPTNFTETRPAYTDDQVLGHTDKSSEMTVTTNAPFENTPFNSMKASLENYNKAVGQNGKPLDQSIIVTLNTVFETTQDSSTVVNHTNESLQTPIVDTFNFDYETKETYSTETIPGKIDNQILGTSDMFPKISIDITSNPLWETSPINSTDTRPAYTDNRIQTTNTVNKRVGDVKAKVSIDPKYLQTAELNDTTYAENTTGLIISTNNIIKSTMEILTTLKTKIPTQSPTKTIYSSNKLEDTHDNITIISSVQSETSTETSIEKSKTDISTQTLSLQVTDKPTEYSTDILHEVFSSDSTPSNLALVKETPNTYTVINSALMPNIKTIDILAQEETKDNGTNILINNEIHLHSNTNTPTPVEVSTTNVTNIDVNDEAYNNMVSEIESAQKKEQFNFFTYSKAYIDQISRSHVTTIKIIPEPKEPREKDTHFIETIPMTSESSQLTKTKTIFTNVKNNSFESSTNNENQLQSTVTVSSIYSLQPLYSLSTVFQTRGITQISKNPFKSENILNEDYEAITESMPRLTTVAPNPFLEIDNTFDETITGVQTESTTYWWENNEHLSDAEEDINTTIIVPEACLDYASGKVFEQVKVDINSLFDALSEDVPQKDKSVAEGALTEIQIPQELVEYSLKKYVTKAFLLQGLLNYIIRQSSLEENVSKSVNSLFPYISTTGEGSLPPVVKFVCIYNSTENSKYPSRNLTSSPSLISKYCADPGVDLVTPIITIDIHSLFKAFIKKTPHKLKIIARDYFSRLDFYKKIRKFDITAYMFRGELLQHMLAFLASEAALDSKVLLAFSRLIMYVDLKGPGSLPADVKIVCNVTVPPKVSKVTNYLIPNYSEALRNESLIFDELLSPNISLPTLPANIKIYSDYLETTQETQTKEHSGWLNVDENRQVITYLDEISGPCRDEGARFKVSFDIQSLLDFFFITYSKKSLNKLMNIIKTAEVQRKLIDFKWNINQTRYLILKDMLTYIKYNTDIGKNHIELFDDILSSIHEISEIGVEHPGYTFLCIKENESKNEMIVSEITEGSYIVKPMAGLCSGEDDLSPAYFVDIETLFSCLDANTPLLAKSMLKVYFSSPDFYKVLNDFKFTNYKSRGYLLDGLLQYLIWHVPMEHQVLHAVNTVVKHIQTDGIGAESPSITIECTEKTPNITRASTASLVVKLDDKQSISMPYLFGTDYGNREDYIDSEELSIVIPRPCVDDGEPSEVLTVDLSSLFEAVENTVSKKALEKVMDMVNKMDAKQYWINFDWEGYKSKGELLKVMLSLLKNYSNIDEDAVNSIEEVYNHVQLQGPGEQSPNIKFVCIVHDNDGHNSNKSHIVNSTSGYCEDGASPILSLNISTLFKAIKPKIPKYYKVITSNFFGKLDFYKKIRDFKFEEYKSQGQLLQELLAFLITETSLDFKIMQVFSNLIQYVRLDGPGALPPSIRVTCNITSTPKRLQQSSMPIIKTHEGRLETFLTLNSKITSDYLSSTIKNMPTTILKTEFKGSSSSNTEITPQTLSQSIISETPATFSSKVEFTPKFPTNLPTITINENITDKINLKNNISIIVIPELCRIKDSLRLSSPILTVDIPSLIAVLDQKISGSTFSELIQVLNSSAISTYVSNYNFDNNPSRGQLLKDILNFARHNQQLDISQKEIASNILTHLQLTKESLLSPVVRFVCEAYEGKTEVTVIADDLKNTSYMGHSNLNYCENKLTKLVAPVKTFDINSLFQAFKPSMPKYLRDQALSLFSSLSFHKKIHGFNINEYPTKGSFIIGMIKYLDETVSPNKKMYSEMYPYIHLDGPGKLPIQYNIVCNITTEKKHPSNSFENIVHSSSTIVTLETLSQAVRDQVDNLELTMPPVTTEINEETSQSLDDNSDSVPGDIIIPDECPEEGTTPVLVADFASLFQPLNKNISDELLKYVMLILHSPETLTQLRTFNWTSYATKASLLEHMIQFFIKNTSQSEKVVDILKNILLNIKTSAEGSELPSLKFVCIETNDTDIDNKEEITEPVLLIPTSEVCISQAGIKGTNILEINIISLFKALEQTAPRVEKAILMGFISEPEFHKFITDIKLKNLQTRSQVLMEILNSLKAKNIPEKKIADSVHILSKYVKMKGPGSLPLETSKTCKTIYKTDKREENLLPINFSAIDPIVNPCFTSINGETYQIDFPSLFYALLPNTPSASMITMVSSMITQEFHSQMKNFDPTIYKTRAELLKSLLLYLAEHKETSVDIKHSLLSMLTYINFNELGALPPNIIKDCNKIGSSADTLLSEDIQGNPFFVSESGHFCSGFETGVATTTKGKTFYKMNITELVSTLPPNKTGEKEFLIKLLTSTNFNDKINRLDFKNIQTRAELLTAILSLLTRDSKFSDKVGKYIENVISLINSSGSGSLPPHIEFGCKNDIVKYSNNDLIYISRDECFLPISLLNNGMLYKLNVTSLLLAINQKAPKDSLEIVRKYLEDEQFQQQGFNVMSYKTKGELLYDILIFLASRPNIQFEKKISIMKIVPHVLRENQGKLPPMIITSCKANLSASLPAEIKYIEWFYQTTVSPVLVEFPNNTSILCSSNNGSIMMKIPDASSLLLALDTSAPKRHINTIHDNLNKPELYTRLSNVNINNFEKQSDLLQTLLVNIWTELDDEASEAAKILLPYVRYEGPGDQKPKIKTVCVDQDTLIIVKVLSLSPVPDKSTWVYISDKGCSMLGTKIPATTVYSINILPLMETLSSSSEVNMFSNMINFLNKPYANKYINGIDIESFDSIGELLRAAFTILRFTPNPLDNDIKKLLSHIVQLVQTKDLGKLAVQLTQECKLLQPIDRQINVDVNVLLHAIQKNNLDEGTKKALQTILDFIESSDFNINNYLPQIDYEKPISIGELFISILLEMRDQTPFVRKYIDLILPYIDESNEGAQLVSFDISGHIYYIFDDNYGSSPKLHNYSNISYEIDFLQLLLVLKPNAPKNEVALLFKFLESKDIYLYLEGFNPEDFKTRGELLASIMVFLKNKSSILSVRLLDAINVLLPFIDFDGIGSLPTNDSKFLIVKNTTNTMLPLNLEKLYKSISIPLLNKEGRVAFEIVFKYLASTNTTLKVFEGLDSKQTPAKQLKLILLKLLTFSDKSLTPYINILLKILEEENKKGSNTLPKIDWIEVLHVIPDEGVPIEVLFAKKDLYKFLMSVSFKTIMKDYRVDLTQTRAKFLKNILSYLRTKPEMQVVKESIAYVYWVIKEDGPGLMPVNEDVIWPEEEEEAQRGKQRASELLYQVLGLLKNDGAFEILQKLQQLFDSSSNLDMGTTYIGYDVMEEFPPKERLLVILRRIYHNYLLFLSEDIAHAIDTVFIQLGEKREEMVDATFIPVDLEQLMKDVLGSYSPPFILDSAKRLVKLVDIKRIPLGKAFEDMVPSILKVNVRTRLAILLRIIWRAYSKRENSEVLHVTQMIYEYIQPSKLGTEMRAQDHHMTIIAALASLVKSKAPQRVQSAKRVTIGYLTSQQHAYDKALANLVTLNLSPLELVARALRRFREHQHEMNPQLWTAVSTIFEYLKVPEHESTEDITDDNFDVVEEFKDLVNEAGQDSESDKQLIVRYIVEKKDDLTKLFRGQRVLLQYSSRDKVVIILERLLRIYGKHLDPKIIDASERILRKLDVSEDESSEEVLSEDIDVVHILDSAVEESASNDVLNAKELVKKTLIENPIIKDNVLEGIIIQKGFNNQRRCSLILRRLYKKFHHQLNKDISRAILKLFDYIKASVSNSAEDQFLGNFTFNGIFSKIFPDDEENDDVIAARKIVLDFLNAGTVRYEDILEGLHLWKLPLDTQAGLVLYRLAKHVNVTSEISSAIDTLIESLDTDLDELAAENKDESVKPNTLFENVFGNTRLPAEVQEAQGLVIHILISGSSLIKDIYRGVDFSVTKDPKDRLVAILKNIHAKRESLGPKISNALKILSAFLHVHLGDEDIDPYTFDFGGLFDMTIPSFAPQSVQRAKYKLLRAIKRRPGPFKKILEKVIVLENETEQETTKKILKAIIHYKRQLSSKIRLATSLLIKFMHGDPIEDILGESLESDEDENESIDDLISIRSLDYEKKPNEKRRWQKRRGARVIVKEKKSSQETILS